MVYREFTNNKGCRVQIGEVDHAISNIEICYDFDELHYDSKEFKSDNAARNVFHFFQFICKIQDEMAFYKVYDFIQIYMDNYFLKYLADYFECSESVRTAVYDGLYIMNSRYNTLKVRKDKKKNKSVNNEMVSALCREFSNDDCKVIVCECHDDIEYLQISYNGKDGSCFDSGKLNMFNFFQYIHHIADEKDFYKVYDFVQIYMYNYFFSYIGGFINCSADSRKNIYDGMSILNSCYRVYRTRKKIKKRRS